VVICQDLDSRAIWRVTSLGRREMLERAGRFGLRPSRLEPKPLAEATAWLESYRQFWNSFVRLNGLLGELKTAGKPRPRPAGRKHGTGQALAAWSARLDHAHLRNRP
jgi:hypothetical protein